MSLREIDFRSVKAWPVKEAIAILDKIGHKTPQKGFVLFETGYGPSGLPHIGTFGEVVRTTMVRKAFEMISDIPTKLFCISDDMDGMRKVPDIIPNSQEYKQYIGLPLTKVPDPFGTHQSYGHNMNARLRGFLDKFNFDYEFFSATECYYSGKFNNALLKVLEKYDQIMDIMLPTLGQERQKTYSPFLPVCPETGHVLQVPLISYNKDAATITYKNELGTVITSEVTNGKCKLQWKPDFGMRWHALDVDFEMYGKDHLVNGPIYTKICQALGSNGPHQMYYELFLDEDGQKISKSKGNGLTIDQWLKYGTQDSLSYFMYLSPQRAKKLYFDVIPKCMDEYIDLSGKLPKIEPKDLMESPAYHVYASKNMDMQNLSFAKIDFDFSYSLLLNLVSASGATEKEVIEGYIEKYDKRIDVKSEFTSELIEKAINYYMDFIEPNKRFRQPTDYEKRLFHNLVDELMALSEDDDAEAMQSKVYKVGRESELELKLWFKAIYEVLLGQSQGPRFGSFIKLYGLQKTIDLIKSKALI